MLRVPPRVGWSARLLEPHVLSMHSLAGVSIELSELYSTFMQKGMRVGFSGPRSGVLRVILREAVRHEWVVLPRNSGGFGLGEGAARRFSARRTVPGRLGKNF